MQGRCNSAFSSTYPMLFHEVHGENIRLEQSSSVARRVESFCKAIVFSSRPIQVNEKVTIRLVEVSSSWSGALRLGFTSHDPFTLQNNLPKYACPDLTNRPGNWAKALGERYAIEGTILHYFVNNAGEVFFGIDGEDKGLFLSGVDPSGPLWALVDIYGNTTTIEMVDQQRQLNNRSAQVQSAEQVLGSQESRSILEALDSITFASSRESCSLERPSHSVGIATPAAVHAAHFPGRWTPQSFHRVVGPNVIFPDPERRLAVRSNTELGRAIVFLARPLQTNEKCLVQVMGTDSSLQGSLTFGLTTCDPATLQQSFDFPDDPECLMDRPEYWVVKKDVMSCPSISDELCIVIGNEGEVLHSVNDDPYRTTMYVDATQQFTVFFDIAGCVTKLKLIGTCKEGPVRISTDAAAPPAEPSVAEPGASHQQEQSDTDCKICFEEPIESAFCNCGHSLTCHKCALKLFKSIEPLCPICRQPIVNVIKIYRV